MKRALKGWCIFLLLLTSFLIAIDVTLDTAKGTDVSGIVYDGAGGPWNLAGSPYIVIGDVTVPFGETLTIEPGVKVKFDEFYSFYVDGSLTSVGTPSSRVNITLIMPPPPTTSRWDRIQINPTGHLECEYTEISYNDIGIMLLSSNNNISNSNISSWMDGIYLSSSSNNNIINNTVSARVLSGIFLDSSWNNTITNNVFNSNSGGIRLVSSSNNNLTGNNASLNSINGISLYLSSNNNLTFNNVHSNGQLGIALSSSSNNEIRNNNISSNGWFGLHVVSSTMNTIVNNSFVNDGLMIEGTDVSQFNSHVIPVDNTANGKPIYYHKNCNNMDIDGISLGQLILVNCTNVSVRNLKINYTDVGIGAAHSSNIIIANNNLSSNTGYGMYVQMSSHDVLITDNNVSSSKWVGIFLHYATNINVIGNTLLNNSAGVHLSFSKANYIENNNASYNDYYGIGAGVDSHNNVIEGNDVYSNVWHGIHVYSIPGNPPMNNITIRANNAFNNNINGISLEFAMNSIVTNNNALTNGRGIYLNISSNNNTVIANNVSNNNGGIFIESSSGNQIYHNYIINNFIQAFDNRDDNAWNDSYPSGGNYWSDWSPTCQDLFRGAVTPQVVPTADGICDFQYDIDADSTDYYPLTTPVDIQPPQILNPLIENSSVVTYGICMNPPPPTVTLTATIDDTFTGGSNVSGANFTALIPASWPGVPMSAVLPPFNSIVEDVFAVITTPTTPGIYNYHIYAWDEKSNYNNTAPFATIIINDDCQPEIHDVHLDGSTSLSIIEGTPSVTLTTKINETNTGRSNIGGANYTVGIQDWGTSVNMDPSDLAWDEIVEDASKTLDVGSWSAGVYSICVYAWDSASPQNNNETGACATLTIIATLPPRISNETANPNPQILGGEVTISATVRDDDTDIKDITVRVKIKEPDGSVLGNFDMTCDSGGMCTYTAIFEMEGSYTFIIWAEDPDGNSDKADGSFDMESEQIQEYNWKPIMALIFTIILLVLGIIVSYKRPIMFKGMINRDRLYTFLLFILPFVCAETFTGLFSYFTGLLSIPPVLGLGMVVDMTILILGIISCLVVIKKGKGHAARVEQIASPTHRLRSREASHQQIPPPPPPV